MCYSNIVLTTIIECGFILTPDLDLIGEGDSEDLAVVFGKGGMIYGGRLRIRADILGITWVDKYKLVADLSGTLREISSRKQYNFVARYNTQNRTGQFEIELPPEEYARWLESVESKE